MSGVNFKAVGVAAVSLVTAFTSSCKPKVEPADPAAVTHVMQALDLPGVDRVPEQEKLYDLSKTNGMLSNLIGSAMVSKIGYMNDKFAFGVAINGDSYEIISSASDIKNGTKEVLIFNDMKNLIEDFNSSIHGESSDYATTTRRICQARADDFMTARQIGAAADYLDRSVSIKDHKVKSGENLSAIAYRIIKNSGQTFNRYEAEASTLDLTRIIAKLNELPEDAVLSRGQNLRIPVPKKGADLKAVIGTLSKGPMLEKISLITAPALE